MRTRRRIRRQRRYPAGSVSAGRGWFASLSRSSFSCSGSLSCWGGIAGRVSLSLARLALRSGSYELSKYPVCLNVDKRPAQVRVERRPAQLDVARSNADRLCLALCQLLDVGGCRAAVQCEE